MTPGIRYNQNMHAIVAIGPQNEIGSNNELLYDDPLDKAWFYNITVGHTVVMGRKTYESIGGPLHNRKNIIMSRQELDVPRDVKIAHGVMELMHMIDQRDTYVIGGEQIYTLLLPYCSYLHITQFYERSDKKPFDAYFRFNKNDWRLTSYIVAGTFADGSVRMRFDTLRRID